MKRILFLLVVALLFNCSKKSNVIDEETSVSIDDIREELEKNDNQIGRVEEWSFDPQTEFSLYCPDYSKVDFELLNKWNSLKKLTLLYSEGWGGKGRIPLTELPDLHKLQNLEKLSFHHQYFTSLADLKTKIPAGIKQLHFISQEGVLTNISELTKLKELEYLTIAYHFKEALIQMKDLSDFEKIQTVDIWGASVDFNGIENLKTLKTLVIDYCVQLNIDKIAELENLEHIRLGVVTGKKEIDIINKLHHLKTLNIKSPYTVGSYGEDTDKMIPLDISTVSILKDLEEITMDGFVIKNISFFNNFPKLQKLDINECKVLDNDDTNLREDIFFDYGYHGK